MTQGHGIPNWYELITDDPDAAQAFYGTVLGWTFSRPPGGMERDYRLASAADALVAGLLRKPEGAPMPPSWLIYFSVDDPDASAASAEAKGARVHMPGTDIPGVGRFAFLADPQGALFYVIRSTVGGRSFLPAGRAVPGHAVWNELSTRDPDAAIDFYGALLGLRQEGAMPMGAFGEYKFLHVGTTGIGAVMGEVPNGRAGWQVYFMVQEIDAAAKRVAEAGGKVLHGPSEIPGGAFSLHAQDPQGARFGLVGRRLG